MKKCYEQALLALSADEVPIGCIIVYRNEIIGRGYNQRNSKKNSLLHAEIIAINEACTFLGDWRLEECSLFVTVEPCPMCAGAIVQSRIKEVIFATRNKKAGCAGSVLNILDNPSFNHRVEIVEGVMSEECSSLMSTYFKTLRKGNC